MRQPHGWRPAILALGMLAIARPAAAGGPARLLEDINQVPSEDRGSYPDHFTRLGGRVLFRAGTHGAGYELWGTDGTAAGTHLVKDIYPGPYSGLDWPSPIGEPPGFVEVNGVLLFPAEDGVHGFELWRTDGTTEGTFLLQDIRPGSYGGLSTLPTAPQAVVWVHALSGGALYFLADDGVHGFELWRTDATSQGTVLLQDIQPGSASAFGSYDHYFLNGATLGSSFYFTANDASVAELWRTDGTPAGTAMVVELQAGVLTVLGDRLLFFASGSGTGSGLWQSDGTAAGTVLVSQAPPGAEYVMRVGNLVYFNYYQHLYRTDGTAEGTFLLHTFEGGFFEFHGDLHGRFLFRANDREHGYEPWISDGTAEGTVLLKDISPPSTFGQLIELARVGGDLYFLANDGVHGNEVWRSDGTPDGTRLVADVTAGPEGTLVWSVIPWQGGLLLRTTDGLARIDAGGGLTHVASPGYGPLVALGARAIFESYDTVHGAEPWSTDGTQQGTGLLADVNPLPRNEGAYPTFLGSVTAPGRKERALYVAYDGGTLGVWATDGTARGTAHLRDLQVFAAGANLGGTLYFTADDGVHGWELWRSDGTEGGTTLVVDLQPGPWGAVESAPVAYKGRLYFVAEDEAHGAELWSSDGTEGGASLVRDIAPGEASSDVTNLMVSGDTLFFTAVEDHGRELWRSDGTEDGTRLVKDIGPGFSGSCCGLMTPFQGRLLFSANDGVHGREPWISDGTEQGTVQLKDIVPGSGSTFYGEMVVAGASAYFGAYDGLHGSELWRTDGTEAGTSMVADILPGTASSFPNFLGPIGDSVAFMVRLGEGPESAIWRSDGTEAGTRAVAPPFEMSPWAAAPFDLGILFSEFDEEHGLELWRTDGTPQGTAFVQDVAPGGDWSNPRNFVRLGTRILFVADDPVANQELFSGRAALLLGRPDQALRDMADELRGLALPKGTESSLLAKLDAAKTALVAGHTDQAAGALENFARRIEAEAGRRVDAAAAADLVEFARDLVELLQGT